MKRAEIHESHEFQRGRTKLKITKKVKLSFFEKIGICSAREQIPSKNYE